MKDLRGFFANYSQSYPQNLWVRYFHFSDNMLHDIGKNFSSYRWQHHDAT
jgi:hypothetical protein